MRSRRCSRSSQQGPRRRRRCFCTNSAGTAMSFSAAKVTLTQGVLAHLDNVGELLAELLTMGDLTRIEVHGPATELEKLKNFSHTSIQRGSRSRKASSRDWLLARHYWLIEGEESRDYRTMKTNHEGSRLFNSSTAAC